MDAKLCNKNLATLCEDSDLSPESGGQIAL